MRKYFFLFIFGLSTVQLWAQQSFYEKLGEAYCSELTKCELDSLSGMEIQNELFRIGANLQKSYKDSIDQIVSNLQSENDSLDKAAATRVFSLNLIFYMIDHCPAYLVFTRKSLPPCPADNKTLQYVAVKINQYSGSQNPYSYEKADSAMRDIMFQAITDIPDELEKDYEGGMSNPQLINDLQIYLMYKCDAYFRNYLKVQSRKLFGLKDEN